MQGGLAVAAAKKLAPIILRHGSEETDGDRSASSGQLWFFASMCLRAWVDRGLLPVIWISSSLPIRLLIDALPGLLGEWPIDGPESFATKLLRKVLPSGFVPYPAPGSGDAILKSLSQSDDLRELKAMEVDRVALLLLVRSVASH